ncbi:hypothetical protein EVAR_24145_1 [Eumeta japonica]|uniref:Uncharacterized protein n=1 Tax=Eumeta variegata TaxID=151549 RepID=A0A4C1YMQ4_EUMVA|nr:hypothetical protein EVAR_24145_1 [Eumeta japonica]
MTVHTVTVGRPVLRRCEVFGRAVRSLCPVGLGAPHHAYAHCIRLLPDRATPRSMIVIAGNSKKAAAPDGELPHPRRLGGRFCSSGGTNRSNRKRPSSGARQSQRRSHFVTCGVAAGEIPSCGTAYIL